MCSSTISTHLLRRHGWAAYHILLIDADAGVSGTKKIDERAGMRTLFRLITDRRIGAVACQDEDRLFRDEAQVQVNLFVAACRSAGVLVLTPTTLYDFNHPTDGEAHAHRFRTRTAAGATYIAAQVEGRFHPARRRLLLEGRWAGPPIPPGYMIDLRTYLPDGSPNPNWRRFALFGPYAAVARAWWQTFLACDGLLRPTIRQIVAHGPYYPPPGTCPPPEGFKVVYRLRQYQGRWCTSRQNLQSMLTNPLYLGHWTVNGRIVLRDTHPAMVDEQTFLAAFNRLSPIGLDGQPNPHYTPASTALPPMPAAARTDVYPLCPGFIFATDNTGARGQVRVYWNKTNHHYGYHLAGRPDDGSMWARRASFVDAVICDALLHALATTYDVAAAAAAARQAQAQVEEEQAFKRTELAQLQTVLANLRTSLATLSHPHLVQAAEQQYTAAEAEAARLQADLAALAATPATQFPHLPQAPKEIAARWPTLTRDEQRPILAALVDHVEAEPAAGNALDLRIHWRDGSATAARVPGRAGESLRWTPEEDARLAALFRQGAAQLEIARALPARTWGSIEQRYRQVVAPADRVKMRRRRVMKPGETYANYTQRRLSNR